jgi:serine/threonine protein kinase
MEDRYTLEERIGRGSFGEVFRGIDHQTKKIVAIKVIDLDQVRSRRGPPTASAGCRLCLAGASCTARNGLIKDARVPLLPPSACAAEPAARCAARARRRRTKSMTSCRR